MVDTGLVDYWKRKWIPERRQCDPDEGQGSRVIGLADTQTAFYLAALGVGLAAVALGLERLITPYRGNGRAGWGALSSFQSTPVQTPQRLSRPRDHSAR